MRLKSLRQQNPAAAAAVPSRHCQEGFYVSSVNVNYKEDMHMSVNQIHSSSGPSAAQDDFADLSTGYKGKEEKPAAQASSKNHFVR